MTAQRKRRGRAKGTVDWVDLGSYVEARIKGRPVTAYLWLWDPGWRVQVSRPGRRIVTFRSPRTLTAAQALVERELRAALKKGKTR